MGTFIRRRRGAWLAAVLVAAALPAASAQSRRPSGQAASALRDDAARLKEKVAAITRHARAQALTERHRTTVTERELNAFLVLEAQDDLPAGVVEPTVAMPGTGRLAGRAVVDLDRVREDRKPTSLLDPTSYLTGRLPVAATGVLRATDGVARFELESAQVAGLPIPKRVLQRIVSYYSRSPERPTGFSLDAPIELPASIREIQVERGRAVIIQ